MLYKDELLDEITKNLIWYAFRKVSAKHLITSINMEIFCIL